MSKIYPAKSLIGGSFGALDEIDGAGLVDGDGAIVITDVGVFNYHLDATVGGSENSPYLIEPDANPGNKRWVLVMPNGPMSHVFVQESVTSLTNATWVDIIHPTEIHDVLGEYNTSTGVFTATYEGYYQVNFCSQVTNSTWTIEDRAFIHKIQVESSDVVKGPNVLAQVAGISFAATIHTSAVIKVSAGEVLTCAAYQNSSVTKALNGGLYNWLTIDRIA